MPQPLPLLTIAGSDSGGAAGLQADLKTWSALGVYGMSAITAVTAQNSVRVVAVRFLSPDFVVAQIDAVLSDYGAAAIKTGFIGRVDLIEAIAQRLAHWQEALRPRPSLVVDPVLVNHRGEAMFGPEVAAAYRERLFPLADLVTPNRAEAELLAMTAGDRPPVAEEAGGGPGSDEAAVLPGLRSTASLGAKRVLLKGLRRGAEVVDVFWDGREPIAFPQPFIDTANVHGSGDTLSAAIAAFVARGLTWPEAIAAAQRYTHAAIARGAGRRLGRGHGPLVHWPDED